VASVISFLSVSCPIHSLITYGSTDWLLPPSRTGDLHNQRRVTSLEQDVDGHCPKATAECHLETDELLLLAGKVSRGAQCLNPLSTSYHPHKVTMSTPAHNGRFERGEDDTSSHDVTSEEQGAGDS
jgi:hypothetical protein